MEERVTQVAGGEQPLATGPDGPTGGPPHLADARALTILTTEHWSLLTARSLVYNEAFARAGMFLTFLTGSLVALGFVAQGSGFGSEFLGVAVALLAFDLLVGLATLGRIVSATNEEFRALQGMTRLRHAYLEMVPSLERYFSTGHHDDLAGVLDVYGATQERPFVAANVLHGLTTAPGMIGMICSLVAAALVACIALLAGARGIVAIAAGTAALAVVFTAITVLTVRMFAATTDALEVRFPRREP